jgi:predicted MFS family arabinose efflux permease
MLTPLVNVVQSSFGEELQGEISGLSRCVSNLGSSLGTAIAGAILVAGLTKGAYAAAMITLAVVGLVGLVSAMLLPPRRGSDGHPARGTANRRRRRVRHSSVGSYKATVQPGLDGRQTKSLRNTRGRRSS